MSNSQTFLGALVNPDLLTPSPQGPLTTRLCACVRACVRMHARVNMGTRVCVWEWGGRKGASKILFTHIPP